MISIAFLDRVHQSLSERLQISNFTCLDACSYLRSDILERQPEWNGMILRSRIRVDKELIDSLPKLEFIGRFGAGMENIDVEYAKSKDIACFRAPEGNSSAVAEQATGMLLGLLHRINLAHEEVKQGIWLREENRGIELESKTVGIIGYGVMGKAFAKRLTGFGCKIIAYDKYAPANDGIAEAVSLEELKAKAQIISLHLPQSKETEYYINENFIESVQHPFVLINTARGIHVKSEDLLKGIQSGKVLAAALDVLDRESSSFEKAQMDGVIQELAVHPKVIITPHIAGWTMESNKKMADSLYKQIMHWHQNRQNAR